MKDEIKIITLGDIFENLETEEKAFKFKDYITNLQTIEQQYSAILSENAELENKITNLQEENYTLDKENKYLDNELGKYKNVIDKIKEKIKEDNEYLKFFKTIYVEHDDELVKTHTLQLINNNLLYNDNILELLEEVE